MNLWDVRAREKAEEKELLDRIDQSQRAINLGRRALALKSATGYSDFLKALRDAKLHAERAFLACHDSNDTLRYRQGRVQGITDVLILLDQSENAVEQLAAQIERDQTELTELRKHRPSKEVRA